MKKVLIIKGDPQENGIMKTMADYYAQGMRDAGFDVMSVDLREFDFNPILFDGYKTKRTKAMMNVVAYMKDADLIAFFYPIWLQNIPAILKGFIENLFWPRESYGFKNKEYFFKGKLKGKKASLFYSLGGAESRHFLLGHAGYLALRHPLWLSGIFSIKKVVFENMDTHKRKNDDFYLEKLKKQIQKDIQRLK